MLPDTRKEAIVLERTNNELNAISRVGDTSSRRVYTGARMKYRNSFGAPGLWQDALPIPLWRDSVQNCCARRNVRKRPHPYVVRVHLRNAYVRRNDLGDGYRLIAFFERGCKTREREREKRRVSDKTGCKTHPPPPFLLGTNSSPRLVASHQELLNIR